MSLNNINLDNLKLISPNLDNMSLKIEQAQNHPVLIRYPSIFIILLYSLAGILVYIPHSKFTKS